MEERSSTGLPKMSLQNLTFEYDPSDPLIVKLNEFRKVNAEQASMIVRQIFDNSCIEAGLESDSKNMIKRINTLLEKVIDEGVKSTAEEQPKKT